LRRGFSNIRILRGPALGKPRIPEVLLTATTARIKAWREAESAQDHARKKAGFAQTVVTRASRSRGLCVIPQISPAYCSLTLLSVLDG